MNSEQFRYQDRLTTQLRSPYKEQNTSERLNNNNKAHGGRQRTSARGCASEAVRVHSGLDFCRDEGLGRHQGSEVTETHQENTKM